MREQYDASAVPPLQSLARFIMGIAGQVAAKE
jgi:hypothetical protein